MSVPNLLRFSIVVKRPEREVKLEIRLQLTTQVWMVHASLSVLLDMSRPQSPVYWRKSVDRSRFGGVNDYLVNLSKQLLKDVRKITHLPPISVLKIDIERELRGAIVRVGTESNLDTTCDIPGHRGRSHGCP